jgi:hypothetical protein
MPRVYASVTQAVAVPVETVYRIIADYHDAHQKILPTPPFGALVVERGGTGAGTVIRFEMKSFGSTRSFRAEISEPDPGRVLVETDVESGIQTTFALAPGAETGCLLTITTDYQRAGLRGWIERIFAPPYLRAIYRAEIGNLARLAAVKGP